MAETSALLLFFVSSLLQGLVPGALGAPGGSADGSLVCSQLVVAEGYPCEEHQVVTVDGFVLSLQRIPHGRTTPLRTSESRPPVLLQHGLMQGADCFLLSDPPRSSLALVLADSGFDVWLGNTRASRWSHGHVRLSRHDRAFWDWSWDDLAAYDLPALLAHAAKHSASQKLLYVGHSQGTLIALAGLMQQPVADLVAGAVLLCPIAYLHHITSAFLQAAAFLHVDAVLRDSGAHEFRPNSPLAESVVGSVCARQEVDCNDLLAAITGKNCCINMTRVPHYFEYEIDSTSVKNLAHFCQMIRRGKFAKYDYGYLGNIVRYGSPRAPAYNPADLPPGMPVLLAYGGMDALADVQDVKLLAKALPTRTEQLYIPTYAHGDFILSTRAKEDVYDKVVDFLRRVKPPSYLG